ncbi:MAG: AgmX/PglI C-terminal domain-containing protein [Kofleriaceae bacterium]|nr:AgmX/PglI C-terminal domain-containing protein [Kofleriaceae bacterium]
MQYCYEKQLLQKPKLAGSITATYVVTMAGKVTSANATGFDKEVTACVVRTIQSVQFPSLTTGELHVSVPISFAPHQ